MTQRRLKVKRGDFVQIMVGKDKGTRGVVTKVFLDEQKVIVSGARQVTRHIRPSMEAPNGTVTKTVPIHVSNVAIIDPTVDAPSRIGFVFSVDGIKKRVFKKSGADVPVPDIKAM
jgi:large subunit ribosomal protein L24